MTYRETESTLARMLDAAQVRPELIAFLDAAKSLHRQSGIIDRGNLVACNGIPRWNESRRCVEQTWTNDDEARRENRREAAFQRIRKALQSLGLHVADERGSQWDGQRLVGVSLQGDPRGAAIVITAAGREWRF